MLDHQLNWINYIEHKGHQMFFIIHIWIRITHDKPMRGFFFQRLKKFGGNVFKWLDRDTRWFMNYHHKLSQPFFHFIQSCFNNHNFYAMWDLTVQLHAWGSHLRQCRISERIYNNMPPPKRFPSFLCREKAFTVNCAYGKYLLIVRCCHILIQTT